MNADVVSSPEFDQATEISCGYCQTEKGHQDDPWFTYYPQQPYGVGPASQESMWLCGFCEVTLACSSWRAGGERARGAVSDIAAMLNRWRTETQPKEKTK